MRAGCAKSHRFNEVITSIRGPVMLKSLVPAQVNCAEHSFELSIEARHDQCSSLPFRLHIELKPRSLAAVIERLEVFSQSPDAIYYSRKPADDMACMVLSFAHASDPVRN